MTLRIAQLSGFILAGCLLAAVPAVAQNTPAEGDISQTEVLRVTSRLVVLDVVVLDRNGDFVPNLDQSQFHLTEDKISQSIRNFEGPSMHAMPEGGKAAVVHSSADLVKIGTAPVNILVFDELNTPFLQLAYARQMMEKYLKAQPEVLPVPTLFIAAAGSRIAVLHDYTQSRADLLESIKKHTTEADFNSMMSSLNGGSGGSTNGLVKTLGAMLQIATSVRGIPGRKNLIWVGTGYRNADDARNVSGADLDKLRATVQVVTNRMLAARLTLYTIDPEGVVFRDSGAGAAGASETGLPADIADAEDISGPGHSFEGFAYASGGRVMFGRNDIDRQIGRTSADGALYYTMAYVPTGNSKADARYRNIRVTLTDPNLRAITRTGYFGGDEKVATIAPNTAKKQPRALQFDLLNAARTELIYNGLHTQPSRTKDGYSLLVTANDLHWDEQADGSRMAEITVIAVCYNAKGKELSQHAAELKQQIEATDKIDNGARVGFAFPMAIPSGTARVRFVLRDAGTGTMGSANINP